MHNNTIKDRRTLGKFAHQLAQVIGLFQRPLARQTDIL
jgi:hypothetical protein